MSSGPGRIQAVFGGLSQWRLARWASVLPRINDLEPEFKALSDYELRKKSLSLRYRARSGEPLCRLLPEAYALVREAGRRTINMRHFDVQILGGIAMFHRSIVEMQTGEGKDAHRHAAHVPARADGQGLPPGHGQRLPRPAATPTGWARSTRRWG